MRYFHVLGLFFFPRVFSKALFPKQKLLNPRRYPNCRSITSLWARIKKKGGGAEAYYYYYYILIIIAIVVRAFICSDALLFGICFSLSFSIAHRTSDATCKYYERDRRSAFFWIGYFIPRFPKKIRSSFRVCEILGVTKFSLTILRYLKNLVNYDRPKQ